MAIKNDPKLKAKILSDAIMLGIAKSAKINMVTTRSIRIWRKELEDDSDLQHELSIHMDGVIKKWGDNICLVQYDAMRVIFEMFDAVSVLLDKIKKEDNLDFMMIDSLSRLFVAIADVMNKNSEYLLTERVINDKIKTVEPGIDYGQTYK